MWAMAVVWQSGLLSCGWAATHAGWAWTWATTAAAATGSRDLRIGMWGLVLCPHAQHRPWRIMQSVPGAGDATQSRGPERAVRHTPHWRRHYCGHRRRRRRRSCAIHTVASSSTDALSGSGNAAQWRWRQLAWCTGKRCIAAATATAVCVTICESTAPVGDGLTSMIVGLRRGAATTTSSSNQKSTMRAARVASVIRRAGVRHASGKEVVFGAEVRWLWVVHDVVGRW